MAIHPAKYYKEVGPSGMNAKPVGTGPYKVLEYIPGKSITLEKNTNYFKDSPKVQPTIGKVQIRFIPDRQTQVAEIISGGADFIMHVPQDQANQLKTMPNVQVVSGNTMRIVFMQMNIMDGTPSPELKDVRVRKAIAHAIDRKAIVKNIVGQGSEILNTICTPSQAGCTDDGATVYNYDPALSKKLLAEAGYPNGFSIDIVAYRERQQTEAIINYLQAVGIKPKLSYLQYAAMRDMVRANKAGLTHQTWASNLVNDVSASTPVYFGFGNDDITRDPEVRDLLDKGDHTIAPAPRKEFYKKALNIIADKAYAVPLWSLPVYYVASKDVAFKPYPDELVRFWDMSWKSILAFLLLHLSGDPAIALAGEGARQADIDMIRKVYGLDRPIPVQYADWLWKLLNGNFGTSVYFKTDVGPLILDKLGTTLKLGVYALGVALSISVPLGVLAAIYKNSWIDRLALAVAVLGQALPNFFFALLLIMLFSIAWGILPVSGSDTWKHFVMPAIALGYYVAPAFMRLIRAGMIEVLSADYIRTARAKGLPARTVIFKHALRNAIVPVVALAAVQLGFLLGGSVVIETIFALNGIGYLAYQSITYKDFPVMQVIVLLLSGIYVLLTLASDIANAWLDPRIRVA